MDRFKRRDPKTADEEVPQQVPGDLQKRPLQIQLPCLKASTGGESPLPSPEGYENLLPAKSMRLPPGISRDSQRRSNTTQMQLLTLGISGGDLAIAGRHPTPPVGT